MAQGKDKVAADALSRHGYEFKKQVGQGSFGQAVLAHSRDGTKLCIKMVDIGRASRQEKEEAKRESQVLSSLKHPYIVSYREGFLEEPWLCIVMDYCDGGDLDKMIKDTKNMGKSFGEDRVLRWFTQAMLALDYIHERHILHRDLKSKNFFLMRGEGLKIGDFGLAKVLECTAAMAATQIGTPYYLSPEICRGETYAWPSDIWAMGIVLFELCAMRVPFDGRDLKGLVQRIKNAEGPPAIAGNFSDELKKLSKDMLNPKASKRPSAEEILQRPIVCAAADKIQNAEGANVRTPSADVARDVASAAAAVPFAEAQAKPAQAPAAGAVAGKAPAPPKRIPRSRDASPAQQAVPVIKAPPPRKGDHANTAGTFKKGDVVEYYSATHGEWLTSKVTAVKASGEIQIDLKPNAWISVDVQAEKVRPCTSKTDASPAKPPQKPPVPKAHEALKLPPKVPVSQQGAVDRRDEPGHADCRDPSPHHNLRDPSPNRNLRDPSPQNAQPLERAPKAPQRLSPEPYDIVEDDVDNAGEELLDEYVQALLGGGYRAEKVLGKGMYGRAVLVQKGEGRYVHSYVSKVLNMQTSSQEDQEETVRESVFLRSLKHPNIVEHVEIFLRNGWLCVVTEYCEGGNLLQRIKDARKQRSAVGNQDRILNWFCQTLLAMEFVHGMDILHGHLKASNCLLSKGGNIKISDVGIAKLLEDTKIVMPGAPVMHYASPETLRGEALAQASPSDVWSLAVILFQVCTLRLPFQGRDAKALLKHIQSSFETGQIPRLSDGEFHPDLVDICFDMFAENPAKRPTCTAILDNSFLRSVVRKLKGDQKTEEGWRKAEGAAVRAAGSPYSGGAPPKPPAKESPLVPKVPSSPVLPKVPSAAFCGGVCNEAAVQYRKGDVMEYWSETHGEWLSAIVTAVDAVQGVVQIDLKPGTWISVDGGRLRMKTKTPKGRTPSPMTRSPAANDKPVAKARQASPARWNQRPYTPE